MKSQSHYAIVLLNYSQSIKISIGPSDGGMIIPTIHRPTVPPYYIEECSIFGCVNFDDYNMQLTSVTKISIPSAA